MHHALQAAGRFLQTLLVILTREATLWTASLDALLSSSHDCSTAHADAPTLPKLHFATQVGLTAAGVQDLPGQSLPGQPHPDQQGVLTEQVHDTDPAVAGAEAEHGLSMMSQALPDQLSSQLYGKSISFCPALMMYVVSLGDASNEDQGVVWLAAPKPDGTGIGPVSPLRVSEPELSTAGSDGHSLHTSAPTGEEGPAVQSGAEAVPQLPTTAGQDQSSVHDSSRHSNSEDEDDEDNDGTDTEDEEEEETVTAAAEMPNVDRSYAVPLLPVSRQELHSPALVLGIPSHGLPGLVAYVFEPATNKGIGCAVVAQEQDMQVSSLQLLCESLHLC